MVFSGVSAYVSIVFLSPSSLSGLLNNLLTAGKLDNTACLQRRFESKDLNASVCVCVCVLDQRREKRCRGSIWTGAQMAED